MSPTPKGTEAPVEDAEFEALLGHIKASRGFDFTGYKRGSLMRRVAKRMNDLKIESFGDYKDHLEAEPEEFTQLFNTILINVTGFFRDALAWKKVAEHAVPKILQGKDKDEPVRVWSAGCASGEEAYTLAMVLAEALGAEAFRQRVKIYATDVDEEALEEARHARYPAKAVEAVPPELLQRYFDRVRDHHVFRPDLRRSVIFGRHNLIQDAPISRLDLLVCRNTLMYFNSDAQNQILSRFHFAVREDGFLFLGRAEMLLTRGHLFTPSDLKTRVFRRVPSLPARDHLFIPVQPVVAEHDEREAQRARLLAVALEASPVAQVVVDAEGRLVLANEKARATFRLTTQDLDSPFQDLELSYRPLELRSRIEQACAERQAVRVTRVERNLPGGDTQHLDVVVAPLLDERGEPQGVAVAFQDVTNQRQTEEQLLRVSQERETAFEELQSTNEELETTNEELQSTVEELETTNEELQSTNEEMETMNEELQSTNEELQTMNDELRERTEEASRANAFLESILTGLNTGVAVLDADFCVHAWNRMAEELWGVRADEVVNQHFLNLDIGLPVEQLKEPIHRITAGEMECGEEILQATTRRGKSVECRVTLTPLRDDLQELSGVILLMEEWLGGGQEERTRG